MRNLPKYTDDYETAADDLSTTAILSAHLDELIDVYGDDWSLEDDEIELPRLTAH